MAERKTLRPKEILQILERIANEKASVRAACEGICDESSFFRRLAKDNAKGEILRKQYARARELRADARFEAVDELLAEMKAGKIDAATARVMIDTIKWQCGREQPKRYSERYEHRLVDGEGNDRSMLAELDRLIAAGTE